MNHIRHTPDNVIEPLYKIPDEEILAIWKTLVPYEFRPGKKAEYFGNDHFTFELRKACSDRSIKRRLLKQLEYAAECTPKEDGDETILRLFDEGYKITEIAEQVGRSFKVVRERIVACHPLGKALK
jgi:hypothetical protein